MGRAGVPLMTEVTREIAYQRPSTIVIYDRVSPIDPGQSYEWRMHVPSMPISAGGRPRQAW